MGDHHRLVLDPNVEMRAVAEFPPHIQEKLGGTPGDVVLSVQRSRLSSQRIDADTARFLRRFAEPRRLVDAVFDHAAERQVDPLTLVEEAYGLVVDLRKVGILTDADSGDAPGPARSTDPRFAEGDTVAGMSIERCVHALADTEIYRARTAGGEPVAVKYVKEDAPDYVRAALRNEQAILARLADEAPGLAPQPIAWQLDGETPFLVIEWCDGQTVVDFLKAHQGDVDARAAAAARLVSAYARLHACGILHGDVHPLNVLVDADDVRLVDFGGARALDAAVPARRMGLLPHYEPEIAGVALQGAPLPPIEPAGEQHNVAALAYHLVTGAPYLRLGLERDAALRQIRDHAPRAFGDVGLAWPEVERALDRALTKDPSRRYPDVAAFAGTLSDALTGSRPRASAAMRPALGDAEASTAVRWLRERYGFESALIAEGLRQGPTASLYHGAAGVAYALLRAACLTGDADLLAAADVWISRGLADAESAAAFVGPEIGLLPGMTRDDSVFHAVPGLLVVSALVHHAAGRALRAAEAVRAFIIASRAGALRSAATAPIDATNGPASHLLAAALVRPICTDETTLGELRAFAASAAAFVTEACCRAPRPDMLLGFAHGRAGDLYALLRWLRMDEGSVSSAIVSRLEELASLGVRDGDAVAWPLKKGAPAGQVWTGWCHGSTGHVLLWTEASKALGRAEYLDLARAAGRHIAGHRGAGGATLCCGLAGEGLALFALGRATGDPVWFERGRELVRAAGLRRDDHANPHGLFRGQVGIVLAAIEAESPDRAAWPVCESPLDA